MCGRFALAGDWHEFAREFDLDEVPGLVPRYNIAPSSGPGFEVPILIERQVLVPARFWFIPSGWRKALKQLPTSFNARIETALEKPMFRGAKRCLVPTTGWREFPGPPGHKRSVNFERRQPGQARPEFFAFGGLWSEWRDPSSGESTHSFAILTMDANEQVRQFHDRMPVLVPQAAYHDWLTEGIAAENVFSEARGFTASAELHTYECSTYGNSTRVEGPECLAPLRQQATLFD
jgi:putative SOS response-associated peptidase YedK